MSKTNVIAVDLGASSGRLISGSYDGNKIDLKEQFRFSNQPINLNDSLYWDYFKIFQEIKYGLSMAQNDLHSIESMGVDTWGVDYGYLDRYGKVLRAPHSYRDNRVLKYLEKFKEKVSEKELFEETGVKFAQIDTIVQLFADLQLYPELKDEISEILMMPNLVEYFFSGVKSGEYTILSTSGLLDAKTRDYNSSLLKRLGIDSNWLSKFDKSGRVLGTILPEIQEDVGLKSDIKIINGVTHDTAAAVHALPIAENESAAFISCGTWSIVGALTKKPVITEQAYELGLTNEGCFDGSNRLLQNITGLWIVQELQKEWSYEGEMIDWGKMVKLAQAAKPNVTFIDPNAPEFGAPGNMEEKIKRFAASTGQPVPQSKGEILRCVYQSLALSYQKTVSSLEAVTGKRIDSLYMFGGGIKNQLLVQMTADFTGKPIHTGPVESSVTGNIISQLEVLGVLDPKKRVEVLKNSFESKTINPQVLSPEIRADIISRFQKISY